jgi:hypothetical protein
MSYYTEISLIILGESTDEDSYCQIIEDVRRVNGKIVAISHSANTTTIHVSAHWDEPEIGPKIERIKGVANVKYVILANQHKVIQRGITESVNISEQPPEWTKESEPVGLVTRAKDTKNYNDALSLAFSNLLGKRFCYKSRRRTGIL